MTDDIPRTPPPRPPTFWNYAHTSVAWPLVALYTVLMGTLSLACSPFDQRGRWQHWCASTWSRLIARTALLDVSVRGAEHLRAGESYVFLSTHQSWMDIPVMLGYLPRQLRIAAKREVFQIPFLGWHMRRSGQIPINRGSTAESIESLRHAAHLLGGGVSAFLFPEGTRTRDGSLQTFKGGALLAARMAKVPIVPLGIRGAFEAWPRGRVLPFPRKIALRFGAPIDSSLPDAQERVVASIGAMIGDGRYRSVTPIQAR